MTALLPDDITLLLDQFAETSAAFERLRAEFQREQAARIEAERQLAIAIQQAIVSNAALAESMRELEVARQQAVVSDAALAESMRELEVARQRATISDAALAESIGRGNA